MRVDLEVDLSRIEVYWTLTMKDNDEERGELLSFDRKSGLLPRVSSRFSSSSGASARLHQKVEKREKLPLPGGMKHDEAYRAAENLPNAVDDTSMSLIFSWQVPIKSRIPRRGDRRVSRVNKPRYCDSVALRAVA